MSDCAKVCLLLWGNHAAQSHTMDALLGSKLAFLSLSFYFFWWHCISDGTSWLIFTLAFCPAVPGLDFLFFFLSWNGYIWLEETWIPSSLPPPLHLPEWSSFLWHIQYHQHYWPDILMRRGLAAKRHLAAAYWACSWLKREDSRCSPGEKDYHTQTHAHTKFKTKTAKQIHFKIKAIQKCNTCDY